MTVKNKKKENKKKPSIKNKLKKFMKIGGVALGLSSLLISPTLGNTSNPVIAKNNKKLYARVDNDRLMSYLDNNKVILASYTLEDTTKEKIIEFKMNKNKVILNTSFSSESDFLILKKDESRNYSFNVINGKVDFSNFSTWKDVDEKVISLKKIKQLLSLKDAIIKKKTFTLEDFKKGRTIDDKKKMVSFLVTQSGEELLLAGVEADTYVYLNGKKVDYLVPSFFNLFMFNGENIKEIEGIPGVFHGSYSENLVYSLTKNIKPNRVDVFKIESVKKDKRILVGAISLTGVVFRGLFINGEKLMTETTGDTFPLFALNLRNDFKYFVKKDKDAYYIIIMNPEDYEKIKNATSEDDLRGVKVFVEIFKRNYLPSLDGKGLDYQLGKHLQPYKSYIYTFNYQDIILSPMVENTLKELGEKDYEKGGGELYIDMYKYLLAYGPKKTANDYKEAFIEQGFSKEESEKLVSLFYSRIIISKLVRVNDKYYAINK